MPSGIVTLTEAHEVSVGAEPTVSVDCRGALDSGETVSSVVVTDADGLTIALEQVSTEELKIKRRTVPTAHAIQFRITAGFAAGTTYEPVLTITTSSGQVIPFAVPITVPA